MALDGLEQLMIELVNRARMDPVYECHISGIPSSTCFSAAKADSAPKPPLAPNVYLDKAAEGHSAWMLKTGHFSHTGDKGTSSSKRAKNAGYAYRIVGENIAMSGTTGTLNREAAIRADHLGLMKSSGHRMNILKREYKEVTVAQVVGKYQTYNAEFTTQMFGVTSSPDVFVTGVAYDDKNLNGFYDVNEGKAGVVFSGPTQSAKTPASGGYGVRTKPAQNTPLRITNGKGVSALTVDTRAGNVKIDLLGVAGVNVYGTLTLGTGPVVNANLIGASPHNLTGNASANVLNGNKANNVISGGGGNDTIDGKQGNDTLTGGPGQDQFVISAGHDYVTDFQDNADKLVLSKSVRGTLTLDQMAKRATYQNGVLTIPLLTGHSVKVKGISGFGALRDDIVLR